MSAGIARCFISLVVTVAAFAWAAGDAAETSARGIRMTVAGDSLALGVGATDSGRGFAFDLYRRVDAAYPRSEVTNLAIGGATTADVTRLEVGRIAPTQPDVILIEAGANDLVRRRCPRSFAADYALLVASVRRAAPRARVVLFNVPDISVSPIFDPPSKPELRRLAVAYDATVSRVARAARLPVVDLFAFSQRARSDPTRYFSADEFHPSDDGHAAIADAAWPTLRRVTRSAHRFTTVSSPDGMTR